MLCVAIPLALLQAGLRLASRDPDAKELIQSTHAPAVLGIIVAIVAYLMFARWIERRRADELALWYAAPNVSAGAFLGALMFATTAFILWLMRVMEIEPVWNWKALGPAAMASATAAVIEEVTFRGLIFRITERSMGTWIALIVSALVFGGIHLLNPNATWFAGLAIVFEAGVFLAAAYVWSRSLWFVIGAHFAWNFTEGGIFGVVVSGNQVDGLLRVRLNGPAFLTGGAFGAETSVVAIAVCLIVAIVLLIVAKNKGRFIKPFWVRPPNMVVRSVVDPTS